MKKLFIFSCILGCLLSINLMSQDQKFVVGMYSNKRFNCSRDSLANIYNMNINTLIHEVREPSAYPIPNFKYVIPSLAHYSTDMIFDYTSGNYFMWKGYENVGNLYVGIKHKFGNGTILGSDSCWSSGTSPSPTNSDSLIKGPNYFQRFAHQYLYELNPEYITYTLKLRVKRGTQQLASIDGTSNLLFNFKILNGGRIIPWADTNIVVSQVNPASGSWSAISIEYKYPRSWVMPVASDFHPSVYRAISSVTSNPYQGTEFILKWNGNYELFIKDIEISDSKGNAIKTDNTLPGQINSYANANTCTNLKNFYSFDEPVSHDNFTPYKDIDSFLPSSKKLITAYVPYSNQDGIYLGAKAFPYWLNNASPQTLMFDFYPINRWVTHDSVQKIAHQFYFLKELCRKADSLRTNNYYYVAQAHGYYDTSGYPDMKKPYASEVSAMTMLALAHGAKGIFYYAYSSSGTGNKDQVIGVDDNPGVRTKITKIGERLNNILGNTLNKLTYSRPSLSIRYGVSNSAEPDIVSDSRDFISLSLPQNSLDYTSFLCSIFTETVQTDPDTKYFFLVNSMTDTAHNTCTKNINFTLTKPSTYVNYRLVDVEKDSLHIDRVDISSNSNISLPNSSYPTYEVPLGEGYLYKYGPVVRIGGRLTSNESINTSSTVTLKAPMAIASGCTLSVSRPYYVDSVITVENGGALALNSGSKIFFGTGGNIVFQQNATTAAEWQQSLLITRKGGHPNLVWHKYANGNLVTNKYMIWRKYESADFELFDSVNNNYTFSYMDTTLRTYEGDQTAIYADYKIVAITTGQPSGFSNTVTLAIHEPYKAGTKQNGDSLKNIPIEFSSKNFPNPFNPATTISYSIPVQSHVSIEIYNVLSQKIAELENGVKQPGEHKSVFNAANLPSGIYFYNLTVKPTDGSKEFRKVNKMLLIK